MSLSLSVTNVFLHFLPFHSYFQNIIRHSVYPSQVFHDHFSFLDSFQHMTLLSLSVTITCPYISCSFIPAFKTWCHIRGSPSLLFLRLQKTANNSFQLFANISLNCLVFHSLKRLSLVSLFRVQGQNTTVS